MNKKKWTSLLMILALLLTLLPAPELSATAEGDTSSSSGMEIKKTATLNDNGTYTITLEAFATGSKVTTTVNKDVPTDIVLVVDQSGSMEDPIGGYKYTEYRVSEWLGSRNYHNDEYYPLRHNGGSENLWHKLDDDKYVAVSVVQEPDYTDISGWRNTDYYNNQSNLYCLIDGEYKTVTVEYNISDWTINYTYKVEGQQILKESGYDSIPDFGQYAPLYQSAKKYIYSYTLNGNTTVIEESFEDGSSPNMQFYKKGGYSSSAGGTRLNALKNAATTFANAVAAKAAGEDGIAGNEDDVKHRIAVVGYASRHDSSKKWKNTEVFVGANQYNYSDNASQYYGSAFQDMCTSEGKANIAASIGAFDADGATYTNYGLEMANGILNASPVPNGETRNRVIILFTDGYPGKNADDFNSAAANAALAQATTAKNGGVTLYAVGIFSGADATTAGDYEGSNTDAANWFMQQVSSNNGTPRTPSYYLSADNAASLNNIFQQISDQIETGGTSSTLTEDAVVKDVISQYFTLPEGADENSIKLETWKCTGKDGDKYTWSKNDTVMGAEASISADGREVSVTGFNFSDNYVGTVTENGAITGYRGHKLVISFVVKPKKEFLGGNGVPTNDSAGVYENAVAKEPVVSATVDPVDVQIKKVVITPLDTNVYLGAQYGATVNGSEIKNNMKLTIGGVNVDLTKPHENFGLADWQNEFVDIKVEVKDENENPVTDFEMLEDKKYSVTVTVTPKNEGTQTAQTGQDEGTIHVFTPELTFKDGNVDYQSSIGNTAYTSNGSDKSYAADNYVSSETKWTHINETTGQKMVAGSGDVKMLGTQPNLFLSYEPTSGVENSKVIATDYVRVQVTVKLNAANGTDVTNKTTFVHQCDVNVAGGCQWNGTTMKDGNPAFLLHVINVVGDLTITKNGLNQHTYTGENEDRESAIFEVVSVEEPSKKWTVAINGNNSVTLTGLKVGSYTVTELNSWTWRYVDQTVQTATVVGGDTVTVTFSNTHNNDKWLGGDNYANNEFGSGN